MGADYTQLSLEERRGIENWWHAKVPVREMARVLKRHKSTIFREIKRNFWADDAFPKKYAGYFGHERSGQFSDHGIRGSTCLGQTYRFWSASRELSAARRTGRQRCKCRSNESRVG